MTDSPRPQKRPAFEPPARLVRPVEADPQMQRPTAITAGVALVVLRVVAGIIWLISLSVQWRSIVGDGIDGLDAGDPALREAVLALALTVVQVVVALALALDLLLAVFVFFGRNWARVVVMSIGVVSITSTFVSWWVQGQEISLNSTLLTLALDILVLLALSSRNAAAFARRGSGRRGRR